MCSSLGMLGLSLQGLSKSWQLADLWPLLQPSQGVFPFWCYRFVTESHSLGDIRKRKTFPFSSLSRKQVLTTGGHGDYRLQFEIECGVVLKLQRILEALEPSSRLGKERV